jgi:hypothetical protein
VAPFLVIEKWREKRAKNPAERKRFLEIVVMPGAAPGMMKTLSERVAFWDDRGMAEAGKQVELNWRFELAK